MAGRFFFLEPLLLLLFLGGLATSLVRLLPVRAEAGEEVIPDTCDKSIYVWADLNLSAVIDMNWCLVLRRHAFSGKISRHHHVADIPS